MNSTGFVCRLNCRYSHTHTHTAARASYISSVSEHVFASTVTEKLLGEVGGGGSVTVLPVNSAAVCELRVELCCWRGEQPARVWSLTHTLHPLPPSSRFPPLLTAAAAAGTKQPGSHLEPNPTYSRWVDTL